MLEILDLLQNDGYTQISYDVVPNMWEIRSKMFWPTMLGATIISSSTTSSSSRASYQLDPVHNFGAADLHGKLFCVQSWLLSLNDIGHNVGRTVSLIDPSLLTKGISHRNCLFFQVGCSEDAAPLKFLKICLRNHPKIAPPSPKNVVIKRNHFCPPPSLPPVIT